jgi:hypothetical protein
MSDREVNWLAEWNCNFTSSNATKCDYILLSLLATYLPRRNFKAVYRLDIRSRSLDKFHDARPTTWNCCTSRCDAQAVPFFDPRHRRGLGWAGLGSGGAETLNMLWMFSGCIFPLAVLIWLSLCLVSCWVLCCGVWGVVWFLLLELGEDEVGKGRRT